MVEGLSPEQEVQVADLARAMAQQELVKIWSGQANIMQVVPEDLHYRGKGIYYSATDGWFAKGPGGSLMKLPGAPA